MGLESQSFHVTDGDRSLVSVWPFRITPERLSTDQRIDQTWFGQDFLALAPSTTVVRAVDLQPGSYGSIHPLIIRDPVDERSGPSLLCVDRTASVDLAGVPHLVVRQARLLSSP
jgi:hypothetical protein